MNGMRLLQIVKGLDRSLTLPIWNNLFFLFLVAFEWTYLGNI